MHLCLRIQQVMLPETAGGPRMKSLESATSRGRLALQACSCPPLCPCCQAAVFYHGQSHNIIYVCVSMLACRTMQRNLSCCVPGPCSSGPLRLSGPCTRQVACTGVCLPFHACKQLTLLNPGAVRGQRLSANTRWACTPVDKAGRAQRTKAGCPSSPLGGKACWCAHYLCILSGCTQQRANGFSMQS